GGPAAGGGRAEGIAGGLRGGAALGRQPLPRDAATRRGPSVAGTGEGPFRPDRRTGPDRGGPRGRRVRERRAGGGFHEPRAVRLPLPAAQAGARRGVARLA